MTDEERAALAAAVERDVDQILRACVPLDWQGGDFREGEHATGCIHPIHALTLVPGGATPNVYCRLCKNALDKSAVDVRVEEYRRAQQ